MSAKWLAWMTTPATLATVAPEWKWGVLRVRVPAVVLVRSAAPVSTVVTATVPAVSAAEAVIPLMTEPLVTVMTLAI